MRKKSELPVEFTGRLIIGIVAAIAVFALASSLFRLSAQATESYIELYNLIEVISEKKPREGKVLALRMDKNTKIFGFSNKGDIELTIKSKKISETPRPSECTEGKSCLCLCKTLDLDHTGGFTKILCKEGKLTCKQFDNAELAEEISTEKFDSEYYMDGEITKTGNYKNGFVLGRVDVLVASEPRIKGVYVEQTDKGKVAVCINPPCYSET